MSFSPFDGERFDRIVCGNCPYPDRMCGTHAQCVGSRDDYLAALNQAAFRMREFGWEYAEEHEAAVSAWNDLFARHDFYGVTTAEAVAIREDPIPCCL